MKGRSVDRQPDAHRHLGFRVCGPGVRLFLPALGEQRRPLAPAPHHRPHGVLARPYSPFRSAAAFLTAYGLWRFPRRAPSSTGRSPAGQRSFAHSTAVSLQIWQLTVLPFFPGSSGYASCFVGWAGMNIVFLLSGAYWLETLLARQLRLRRAVAEDGGMIRSSLPAVRLFRVNLEGCTYFWVFIALVALFFWALFYVV